MRSAVTLAKLAQLFKAPVYLSVGTTGDGKVPVIAELAAETAAVPLLTRTMIPAFDDEPTRKAIARSAAMTLSSAAS